MLFQLELEICIISWNLIIIFQLEAICNFIQLSSLELKYVISVGRLDN